VSSDLPTVTRKFDAIIVGAGQAGPPLAGRLTAAGQTVAVIERNEDNRFLSAVRDLDVPVIFGDATLRQTLQAARVDRETERGRESAWPHKNNYALKPSIKTL